MNFGTRLLSGNATEGDCLALGAGLGSVAGGGLGSWAVRSSLSLSAGAGSLSLDTLGPAGSGLGDLTLPEVQQIQAVVDEAGRPLEVVGSAARGERRGIGTDLPIGKGDEGRSDIDYLIPHGSAYHYEGLYESLPSIDPKGGPMFGVHNPFIGPAIRFEPGAAPYFVPAAQ